MRTIPTQPTLVERVVETIISEIVDGDLPSNTRLIQDELAQAYGVSRHPVQQALLLLKTRGRVGEARGAGLASPPLAVNSARNLNEIRAMPAGLPARMAAEHGAKRAAAEGPAYLAAGRAAIASGVLNAQIEAD